MGLLGGIYSGYDYLDYIPDDYFAGYLQRVEQYVEERKGNLDRNKITERARLTLALTPLGYDITDVAGHDFIERFSNSHRFSYRQGINGAALPESTKLTLEDEEKAVEVRLAFTAWR